MKMQAFTFADAAMERWPDQEDEIETGDVVNDRDGAPISIGYGRWGPLAVVATFPDLTLQPDDERPGRFRLFRSRRHSVPPWRSTATGQACENLHRASRPGGPCPDSMSTGSRRS